jgi:CubicO group peptidase (beta-lactamase class C family)
MSLHLSRRSLLIAGALAAAISPALARSSACTQRASEEIAAAPPEQVGMRSGRLADAIESLRGNDRDIHALVVLRDCRMVLELYAEHVTRDHNHALYSVTKSVLATLLGVLLKSGRVSSLELPVAQFIAGTTALDADRLEKARRIRIRDVMSMSSGLSYRNNPRTHPIYGPADRLAFALGPPFVSEPGERFNYSNGDASIAGAVVAAAANKDLLSYGHEVLFGPLGFKNVEWWFRDDAGRYPGGWGLRLRAVDMAKLGQLYLQNGRWQDTTIIDAEFIADAWRPGPKASHYGLFWWRWVPENPQTGPVHFADGFKGQRIYVLPKHGIVIAVNANVSGNAVGKVYNALIRAIVAAVQSDEPIYRSTSDADRLAEQLRLPFSGKPGNYVSGQDFPRPPE